MMRRTVDFQDVARCELQAFAHGADTVGRSFAVFTFADEEEAERINVYLTPDQVLRLTRQAVDAVERLRAAGDLPAEPEAQEITR